MEWYTYATTELSYLLNKHRQHDKRLIEIVPDQYDNGLKLLQCYDCNEVIVVDEIRND